MIVVDTNIIAYLYLPCEFTEQAEALLLEDGEWAVPILWRSEFRNILAGYVRRKTLSLEDAVAIQREAEAMLAAGEHDVESAKVLQLVNESDCSAYDCEFVALATSLETDLYTMDRKLLRAFPAIAKQLFTG